MSKKVAVPLKLPQHLLDEVDQLAQETGINRTALITDAIVRHLRTYPRRRATPEEAAETYAIPPGHPLPKETEEALEEDLTDRPRYRTSEAFRQHLRDV